MYASDRFPTIKLRPSGAWQQGLARDHSNKAETIAASLYAAIQQLQSAKSPVDDKGEPRYGGQSALMVNMTSSKSYSMSNEEAGTVNEAIQLIDEMLESTLYKMRTLEDACVLAGIFPLFAAILVGLIFLKYYLGVAKRVSSGAAAI